MPGQAVIFLLEQFASLSLLAELAVWEVDFPLCNPRSGSNQLSRAGGGSYLPLCSVFLPDFFCGDAMQAKMALLAPSALILPWRLFASNQHMSGIA